MKFKTILAAVLLVCAGTGADAQRFAILSDIHVTPGNANEGKLRQAVDEINAGQYDIVVVDGDLTNEGSDAELANVKSILDGIRHPLFVLPGNHENNWSQSATKTFIDLWGNDRFVTEVDSLLVIGINCGPFMKMGDGHIKQEDLHWLKATLDERVKPGMKVVNFNHYPLNSDLDNCNEYIRVLEQYPVIAHVNGHYHNFDRYKGGGMPGGIECMMVRALDMRKGDYGYTVMEVDPQWIHVYNKELGKERNPRFAFPVRTDIKPLEAKDAAKWTQPEGWSINKVWTDSASIFTRLGFDAERVYFGNSLGQARAVDKATGTQVWTHPTGASLFSRPVVTGRKAVAVPYSGGILMLDPRTGRTLKDIKSKQGPYVADGVLADGAYLQGGYKRMERRNPATGKLVWEYDSLFNYCQAAPVVDRGEVIFGAWDTNLRNLDLMTGKLKWVWNNGKPANMLGPGNVVPAVTPDKVITVAPDRYMTAIDRATGRQIWRDNSVRYRESMGYSPARGEVYAKTMDGELVAVDATTPDFNMKWKVDMGLGYEHAPCVVVEKDGVVYAGSRRGIVTAVDPDKQQVIWSLPLGVSEINGIDVDPTDGSIWVSLIEGTVFRIARK